MVWRPSDPEMSYTDVSLVPPMDSFDSSRAEPLRFAAAVVTLSTCSADVLDSPLLEPQPASVAAPTTAPSVAPSTFAFIRAMSLLWTDRVRTITAGAQHQDK